MTEITPNLKTLLCEYFESEEDEVEIETGFVELEEDNEEDGIEWLWEEEIEPEVDGPIGPFIIKKGRYVETV